jgi:hypothetical protein
MRMYRWDLERIVGWRGLCFCVPSDDGGEKSWIRTRPGLAQSFGWVLSGSNASGKGWGPRAEETASIRVRARGEGVARDLETRRPWDLVRVLSK